MPFMTPTLQHREAPKMLRATPDLHFQPQALWQMEGSLAKSPSIFEALVMIPGSLSDGGNKMAECSFKAIVTKCPVEIHDKAGDPTLKLVCTASSCAKLLTSCHLSAQRKNGGRDAGEGRRVETGMFCIPGGWEQDSQYVDCT